MFAKKILLAVDGSPGAERASRVAVALSRGLGAELHVVHVGHVTSLYAASETELLDPEMQARLTERAASEARAKLDEGLRAVREMGGEVAGAHVDVGRADAGIVRIAEDVGADLIVLGSRGLGPLRRALLGSVSESVAHHSRGSVLVVRDGATTGGEGLPGKILLALDGSREAAAAARAAVEVSNAAGSELHVVFALETQPQTPFPGPMMGDRWREAREETERKARSWLAYQEERITAQGGRVKRSHLVSGKPEKEIVKLAEDLGAGMIVMGSRGLGRMARALIGSVSDAVLRHAHCPVLLVRDPDRGRTSDLAGAGTGGEASP